jgi:hypothetical protein
MGEVEGGISGESPLMFSLDYVLVEPLAPLRDAVAGNSKLEELVDVELWTVSAHGRGPRSREILRLKAAFLVYFRRIYTATLAELSASESLRLPLERLTLDHFDAYWSLRWLPSPTSTEEVLEEAGAADIRAIEGRNDTATIEWLRTLPGAHKGSSKGM